MDVSIVIKAYLKQIEEGLPGESAPNAVGIAPPIGVLIAMASSGGQCLRACNGRRFRCSELSVLSATKR